MEIFEGGENNRFPRNLNTTNLFFTMSTYTCLHANQKKIVDYIVGNPTQNVLVTGAAGTGKSWVRKAAYEQCKGINTIQIGPTGTSVRGLKNSYTLMLFLGAECGMSLPALIERGTVTVTASYLQTAQIFLEEVALINAAEFDALHAILCRIMGRTDALFGGIRTVFFYDIMQLKPSSGKTFYESTVFTTLPLHTFRGFRLEGSNRITDTDAEDAAFFEDLLTAMRDSDMSSPRIYEYILRDLNRVYVPPDVLHICATNKLVTHYNTLYIKSLAGLGIPTVTLHATTRSLSNTSIESVYIEKHQVPEKIIIGKGSRVQFTSNLYRRNTPNQLHVTNGTFGIVNDIIRVTGLTAPDCEDEDLDDLFDAEEIDIYGKPVATKNTLVRVTLQDTNEIVCVRAKEYTYTDTTTGTPLLHVYQWPLTLAFATTVHRVQGMSLDRVCVVGTSMTSASLAYTACSRARTLRGLYGIDMHPNIFTIHNPLSPQTKACIERLNSFFLTLTIQNNTPEITPRTVSTPTPLTYVRSTKPKKKRAHPYKHTNTSKEHRLLYIP